MHTEREGNGIHGQDVGASVTPKGAASDLARLFCQKDAGDFVYSGDEGLISVGVEQ